MKRLHLLRNLHTSLLALVVLCVAGAVGFVFWLNHVGLTADARGRLTAEIARHGVILDFASLRYEPLEGLVAREVEVFAGPERERTVARLGSVVIDVDKTKLMRGILRVTKIELADAQVALPLDPADPASEKLLISDFSGSVFFGKRRDLAIRRARGTLHGIDLELDVRLRVPESRGDTPTDEREMGLRVRRLFAQVVEHLGDYDFDPESPPRVSLSIQGDLEREDGVRCEAILETAALGASGYRLEHVRVDARYERGMLTLRDIQAADGRGSLHGRADYLLGDRSGRFAIESSLDLPRALEAFAPGFEMNGVALERAPTVTAEGNFRLPDGDRGWEWAVTGHASCPALQISQLRFHRAATDFSVQNDKVLLRDLHLSHRSGTLDGKVLITPTEVRCKFESTLPAAIYEPFFEKEILGEVLRNFTMDDATRVGLEFEGEFSRVDPYPWACRGRAEAHSLAYAGVPAHRAQTSFSLSSLEFRFEDIEIDFDYRDYPMRVAHDGPADGHLAADSVIYDRPSGRLYLENIRGTAWPAPVLRLFHQPIADQLEAYEFHTPPELESHGVIDFDRPETGTDLVTRFRADDRADYRFLAADLPLWQPRGSVRVHGTGLEVRDLAFGLFSGQVQGNVRYSFGDPARFGTEVRWSRLPLDAVARAWDLGDREKPLPGFLTGRLELSGIVGRPQTYSGKGLLTLNEGELFTIPMFGPLSPLVSGVLGKREAGFQHAREAFLSFDIRRGILRTADFHTATPSLVLTGDGSLSLANRQLDFTVRMNARGLLGLLTLPLRPFYGLFQFRGTGPAEAPHWDHVIFTRPPDGEANPVFSDPPRARVVPE